MGRVGGPVAPSAAQLRRVASAWGEGVRGGPGGGADPLDGDHVEGGHREERHPGADHEGGRRPCAVVGDRLRGKGGADWLTE